MVSRDVEAKETNERLLAMYGKHILSGLQNFRVVWSDEQLEKKFGTFEVYANEIFIRTETGIREAPKYAYLDNQWVVERVHPNFHPDIMEGSYVYEPLWAFPTGLPIKWEAVDYCVKAALKMIADVEEVAAPKTEAEAIYQDGEKKKQEVKEAREVLDNISNESELELRLHDGDAVSLSGTSHKENHVG